MSRVTDCKHRQSSDCAESSTFFHVDIRQSLAYQRLAACLVVALFVVFSLIDPLALRTSAEKHYNNMLTAISSPFYAEQQSSEIVVVLIDESYFRTYQESLANYSNLAALLRIIDSHDPVAVYFNFLQHYRHSGIWSSWLRRLKKADTTTYIASLPTRDTKTLLSKPNSLRHQLNNVTDFAAVNWQGADYIYPLWVGWHQSVDDERWDNAPVRHMPTPALAMYAEWCKANADKCEHSNSIDRQQSVFDASDFHPPMYVRWGEQQSALQSQLMPLSDSACTETSSDTWQSAIERFFFYLHFGLGDKNQAQAFKLHCPPYLSISASRLLDSNTSQSLLEKVLKDRIVLVGYDNKVGQVESPIHGSVASIYLHAAATDNLIRQGNGYWKVPASLSWFRLSIFDLVQLCIQSIVLYLATRYQQMLSSQEDCLNWGEIAGRATSIIKIILLSFVLTMAVSFVLDVGFFNWYAIPLIICIFFLQMLWRTLLLCAFQCLKWLKNIADKARELIANKVLL